jgi:Asp-tRNA(Asn)/Glu-tRNA(Gln) amidotransferase A subunit family amidase
MDYFGSSERVRQGLAGVLGPRAMRSALTRAEQERWRATMAAAMRETGLLALATVPFFPSRFEAAIRPGYLALTSPENLAGSPALALPMPTGQQLPPVCRPSQKTPGGTVGCPARSRFHAR